MFTKCAISKNILKYKVDIECNFTRGKTNDNIIVNYNLNIRNT